MRLISHAHKYGSHNLDIPQSSSKAQDPIYGSLDNRGQYMNTRNSHTAWKQTVLIKSSNGQDTLVCVQHMEQNLLIVRGPCVGAGKK